jgi:hypothetical protein
VCNPEEFKLNYQRGGRRRRKRLGLLNNFHNNSRERVFLSKLNTDFAVEHTDLSFEQVMICKYP